MRNKLSTRPSVPGKLPFHSEHTGHNMSFRNNWKDCDAFGADTAGHQKEEKTKHSRHNITPLHGAHKATVGSNEKTGDNYTESP